eukprot:CAMPEP_0201274496 /NCGR_PEP_ID=MMETSP0853-20130426/49204_1 /ASSEMBLY_ACC=CAM_ASM_000640 /TAXON_ID=183588 /ORGANISM="Pseudo-nitzschia fraudulenta, Strain WWA7" /LENGTH=34 /DNA_ID= /DNA_START= /DNA_END= /DNA_ORIENTATION=
MTIANVTLDPTIVVSANASLVDPGNVAASTPVSI